MWSVYSANVCGVCFVLCICDAFKNLTSIRCCRCCVGGGGDSGGWGRIIEKCVFLVDRYFTRQTTCYFFFGGGGSLRDEAR